MTLEIQLLVTPEHPDNKDLLWKKKCFTSDYFLGDLRESVLKSGLSLIVGLNHRPLSITSSVQHP